MGFPVHGAGLGLRRGLLPELADMDEHAVDFMELAPENWIGVGGRFGRQLRLIAEKFPLVCHGLSLSIGSPAPLDTRFLNDVKNFLDTHGVLAYTEHLSYCSDDKGHLYDLMPIPFTSEAVTYVAKRIVEVQDVLERRDVIRGGAGLDPRRPARDHRDADTALVHRALEAAEARGAVEELRQHPPRSGG